MSERVSVALAVPRPGTFAGGEVRLAGSNDDDPLIIVRGRDRLLLRTVELQLSRVDLRAVDVIDGRDTDLDTDTDHDTDTDSDTDTDGFDVIRLRNPVRVVLPLRGDRLVVPFSTVVPVGTYDRARFRIESVRVVGAFDDDRDGDFEHGEWFDETVRVRQHFTIRIRPPLVVREGEGANVTIAMLVPEWFRNRDRSLFSPRRLNHDHQLRARFRHLIRTTLRAIEDANRDGDNDRDTDSDH